MTRGVRALLMVALAAPLCVGTSILAGQSPPCVDAREASAILAGDARAIQAAARSGNTACIPPLRTFVDHATGSMSDPLSVVAQAHRALAQLGDVRELQDRWCRAISTNAMNQNSQIRDLAVGGWFEVFAVSRFLLPEYAARAARARAVYLLKHPSERDSDMIVLPPETQAMAILTEDVHDPPMQRLEVPGYWAKPARFDEARTIWFKWIDDHRESLQQLRPTGAGVNFSDSACITDRHRQ